MVSVTYILDLLLDHIKILSPQGSDGDNEQHCAPGTPENLIDEDFGDGVDYIQLNFSCLLCFIPLLVCLLL